jgi:hypothetical protein
LNEKEMLEEIARLKKLTTNRTVKQAFKDAYKRWYDIMASPNDWDGFGEFAVFLTTIMVAFLLVVLCGVAIILTKGLLALPLLAYPIWVLFRREE